MRKAALKSTTTFQLRDFSLIKKQIALFASKLQEFTRNIFSSLRSTNSSGKYNKFKKFAPLGLLLIVIGVIIIISTRSLVASTRAPSEDTRVQIKGPRSTMAINKEFSFPLLDAKGKELTSITYVLESAELRDEIIVKGTRATAIKGRTFLILSIKVTNNFDKALQINVRDYVRLSVNGNAQELTAADIHNDPVQVQPISVKTTRIGFPINDTDKDIILKVGEVKGEKQDVPLSF